MTYENYQSSMEIGKRNLTAENHWELIDLENLTFNKPTVLCFSGNGTITNEDANGLAKKVENDLGLMFTPQQNYHVYDHVDIMSIKYAQTSNDTGKLSVVDVERLANTIFALLVDQNGNKLDLTQAKKNMSRITFFTYCYGSFELSRVVDNLNEKLAAIGYTNDEIVAINNATLEVSYAPLTLTDNKVPSVRAFSKNDQTVSYTLCNILEASGVLTGKQDRDNLNGVHLHKDKPGTLYGRISNAATAESIQIISSGLINSYFDREHFFKEIDDHDLTLITRDHDWKLKPTSIDGIAHQSYNADCVSQMMAWALCKGVEHSIHNFHAEKYMPNTYWNELTDDFKSIINSFGRKKLSKNILRETKLQKNYYETARQRKRLELMKSIKVHPSEEIIFCELSKATNFKEVMLVCEKYDYYHADKFLNKLDFLTDDERLILQTAQENKALPQKKMEYGWQRQCKTEIEQSDKSFASILKILDRYEYRSVGDLLGQMNYLTTPQKSILKDLSQIKTEGTAIRNKFKLQFVKSVPEYQRMLNRLNNANSLEQVIKYGQQADFTGFEFILPAVEVLTHAEKNAILAMAGKPPLRPELGIELGGL